MSCVFSCFLRNGGNAKVNPILSPNNAPDCLLNELPRIVLTACEADVLRDQAIYFLDRLLRADGGRTKDRARMIFFKDYIHGFNNFDMKHGGVHEYHVGTGVMIQAFKDLFESLECNP